MGHQFHLSAEAPPTSGSANQEEKTLLTKNLEPSGKNGATAKALTTTAVTSAPAPVSQAPPPGAPGSGVMGAKVALPDLSSSGSDSSDAVVPVSGDSGQALRLLRIVILFLS